MKQYKIKECFSLRARIGWQGLRAEEFIDNGPYLVTGTDFVNGKINWDICYHVNERRYRQDLGIQLKEHDLLITKDGTIGKTAVVHDCPEKATLNSGVFVVRAVNGNIVPEFLYYVLNSHQFDLFIRNILTGSTIKHLNQEHFYKFTFEAPDVPRQSIIAEILTTVDETIDNTRTLIEKYSNVKTGMMQDLLTNGIDEHGTIRSSKTHKYKDSPLGRIPVEWDIVDLFEWSTKQSDSIVDGPFGSNLKLIHYKDSGIPVIQSGFVTTGKFVAKKYVFVDKYKFREQYRCRVYPLDIIMSKIGAQCGRCAVLPLSHPVSIIAGNCIKMTVDKNYNPYLLHELLSYYYQLGYFDFIRSVTAQPAISLTKLKKFKVVFIPKEEQKRIYQIILSVNNKIQTERNYLVKLQNIKKGLMQDLLTNIISVDSLL